MATINDLREVLSWGALSAYDQWSAGTRWNDGRKRPTDREIVTKVQAGIEIGGDDLKRFAMEYGVGRFPQCKWGEDGKPELDGEGKKIKQGGETARLLSASIERVYRPAIMNYGGNEMLPDGKALAELWWDAIEAVKPHTRQMSMNLCKKTMWFYLPDTVTMWDSFAARSLLSFADNLKVAGSDHTALGSFP